MVLAVVCAGGDGIAKEAAPPPLSKHDLLTWPRSGAAAFGCFIEKAFGSKDRRFNCALKRYRNRGDPCKNTKAYHEGPVFPPGKAAEVHPLAREIRLVWEHGDLQEVQVTLGKRLGEDEVRKAFRLPKDRLPAQLTRISIQQCSKLATCILLEGFDHMGAGEVDCPPPGKRR
jgi:hypothetical protein